jgi:AcrR family transcriptional regulator
LTLPSRKDRNAARARSEILDAAVEAFAQMGYEAATMQDIASRAGYTAASLYTYFPSKQAIIEELVETVHKEILDTFLDPIPESLSFVQRLEVLTTRQMSFVDKRRMAFVAVFSRPPKSECEQQPDGSVRIAGFALVHARLTQWIEANAQPDELGGQAPADVALVMMGITQAFFLRWLSTTPTRPFVEMAPRIVHFFTHGALAPAAVTETSR